MAGVLSNGQLRAIKQAFNLIPDTFGRQVQVEVWREWYSNNNEERSNAEPITMRGEYVERPQDVLVGAGGQQEEIDCRVYLYIDDVRTAGLLKGNQEIDITPSETTIKVGTKSYKVEAVSESTVFGKEEKPSVDSVFSWELRCKLSA